MSKLLKRSREKRSFGGPWEKWERGIWGAQNCLRINKRYCIKKKKQALFTGTVVNQPVPPQPRL